MNIYTYRIIVSLLVGAISVIIFVGAMSLDATIEKVTTEIDDAGGIVQFLRNMEKERSE